MLARNLSESGLLFVILFLVITILFGDRLSIFLTKVFKGNEKIATIVSLLIISFLSANLPSIIQIVLQAFLAYFMS